MRRGLARAAWVFDVYPVLQALLGKGLVFFHLAGIFRTWPLLLGQQPQAHQDLVCLYGGNIRLVQFQQVGDRICFSHIILTVWYRKRQANAA